ncbi:hypothetical protein HYV86_00575 [Candidatus Woesearchaeota archaeon]|nr:hypothetical protein [Candidatus Woesearchaeota archaeon]
MKEKIWFVIVLFCSLPIVLGATIQGSIYNDNLDVEKDVLIEINSTPPQKYLAKEGTYMFIVPLGEYSLSARKAGIDVVESLHITQEGTFVFDVFLLEDISQEEELWDDTQDELVVEQQTSSRWWAYVLFGIIVIGLLARIIYMRHKYGSVAFFRRRIKAESIKPLEVHEQEVAASPQYLDDALAIITKHDGRIHQKDLRKEMGYLSEAKVSLILTELEHKGLVEKVKKGRGNVVLLKNSVKTLETKKEE